MIGRSEETKTLEKVLQRNRSSFLAITDRRRIGKTFLIDDFLKRNICFRMTGIQNAKQIMQLANFSAKLLEYSKTPAASAPENWHEAFLQFRTYLLTLDKKTKQVIFIDELPWIATARSEFLSLLAHL